MRSSPGRRSNESARDRRVRHQPFAEQEEKKKKGKALKNELVAFSGEFIGTLLFLWLAFAGTQVANATQGTPSEKVMLISMAFGFSLLVTVWAFYRISGGLFNPAVTMAMVITGNLPLLRGLVLFPAQILGGICAAALVSCMFPLDIAIVVTRLTNGTSKTQGVFIEMILTSILVFTILMLAAEKHYATFMAPVGIGLALFVCELAGVFYTGGSLNPARSFGPDVVARSFEHYHYIYWFGPIMGGLLAAGYYKFVKFFNYEEVNPGQDDMPDGNPELKRDLKRRESGKENGN